jgi:hypothetical protein
VIAIVHKFISAIIGRHRNLNIFFYDHIDHENKKSKIVNSINNASNMVIFQSEKFICMEMHYLNWKVIFSLQFVYYDRFLLDRDKAKERMCHIDIIYDRCSFCSQFFNKTIFK